MNAFMTDVQGNENSSLSHEVAISLANSIKKNVGLIFK
jgi:hypothetical protein